jgi:hypothetical protein
MVEKCNVQVAGDLRDRCQHDDDLYRDKVQVFHWDQFTCPDADSEDDTTTSTAEQACNLKDCMDQVKPLLDSDAVITCNKNNNSDSNDLEEDLDLDWDDFTSSEDMREQALLTLHDVFLPIVREILTDPQ